MDIAENRTVLLDAALRLFSGKGFDTVSVEALRKEAGLSNGSFFYLYPNKAALAADLLVASVTAYQAALLAPLEDEPGAADGIAGVIIAMFEWAEANPERMRFMLGEARAAWFALAAEPLRALNDRFRLRLDAWREPHVAAGTLADMPADVFVATLIGPANLIARHGAAELRAPPGGETIDGLVVAAQRALGCAGTT